MNALFPTKAIDYACKNQEEWTMDKFVVVVGPWNSSKE
jgi:hypothetical protein